MTVTPHSHPPRNPADLLRLGTDPALSRLLRACGADEACIAGGASDYDQFLALAAALPLCEGHPLRDAVNASLQAATGVTAPLCPHTADRHWSAWVEIHHYGGKATAADLPAVCPCCVPAAPRVILAEECTTLPDPVAVHAPDLTAWSQALVSSLPPHGTPALYRLPSDYTFTRPNPYHANLAVGKACRGEELSRAEEALLVTQALRVWGPASVSRGVTLLLRGGAPDGVTALLGYLETARALPSLVWIPDSPAQAGEISGLYRSVKTGMTVTSDGASPAFEAAHASYASAAPIGACVFVEEAERR